MPRAARYWEVAAESWAAPVVPAVESESAAGVSDAAARRGSSAADEMRQRRDEAKVSKRHLGARPSRRAARAGWPENPSRGHTTSTPFAEQKIRPVLEGCSRRAAETGCEALGRPAQQ